MTGETSITVIGNLTSDPELRFTPASPESGKTDGTPVANFTIASTPRTFDPATREWKDGDTLFLRATVWREAAQNVAASLSKGSRVVASGVLKPRTFETRTGEKRTVIELEVDEIGLSLRYTAATPANRRPDHPVTTTSAADQDSLHPVDRLTMSPRQYTEADEAWFGKHANPAGRINLPGAALETSRD